VPPEQNSSLLPLELNYEQLYVQNMYASLDVSYHIHSSKIQKQQLGRAIAQAVSHLLPAAVASVGA
jgi:hypothetical protein